MVGDWKRVGFKRVEWLSRPHRTGHFGYDSLVAALQGRREGVDDRELLVANASFVFASACPSARLNTRAETGSSRQLDPKRGGGPLLTAQRFDNKRAFFFYTIFPAAALARFVVEDEWVR